MQQTVNDLTGRQQETTDYSQRLLSRFVVVMLVEGPGCGEDYVAQGQLLLKLGYFETP